MFSGRVFEAFSSGRGGTGGEAAYGGGAGDEVTFAAGGPVISGAGEEVTMFSGRALEAFASGGGGTDGAAA
jgi:hypothetical protein